MNLSALYSTLEKSLAAFYVVHSDEELLTLEALGAIRKKARSEGFSERQTFTVERGFNWGQVGDSLNEMSLFGDKKIVEVTLPKGIDKEATAFLTGVADFLNEAVVLLLSMPRMTSKVLSGFAGVLGSAVVIDIPQITHSDMPAWLEQRLRGLGYRVEASALEFLVARTEGNLLAANQELQKLPLLYPVQEHPVLTEALLLEGIANVSRYDPYRLYQPLLEGDSRWLTQMLQRLEEEGSELPPLLWSASHEVRTLLQLKLASSAEAAALKRNARIWGDHEKLVTRALPKLKPAVLQRALFDLLEVERSFKGVPSGRFSGNPWVMLRSILLKITLNLQPRG